jgi:hypothetical protein
VPLLCNDVNLRIQLRIVRFNQVFLRYFHERVGSGRQSGEEKVSLGFERSVVDLSDYLDDVGGAEIPDAFDGLRLSAYGGFLRSSGPLDERDELGLVAKFLLLEWCYAGAAEDWVHC